MTWLGHGVASGLLAVGGFFAWGCDGSAQQSPIAIQPGTDPASLEPGPIEPPSGGTRLKALFAEASSGTRQFVSWYDTVLETRCTFVKEDEWRCLPEVLESVPLYTDDPQFQDRELFLDEQCTQRGAHIENDYHLPTGCAAPRFVYTDTALDQCRDKRTHYRVLSELLHPEFVYYHADTGQCIRTLPSGTLGARRGTVAIATEPFTDFVTGTLVAAPVGETGPVVPVFMTTADGAQAFHTFRDTEGSFDCDLKPTPAGTRCVPRSEVEHFLDVFGDSACKVPVGIEKGCLAEDFTPFIRYNEDQAGTEQTVTHIYHGGSQLSSYYYRLSNNGCSSLEARPIDTFAIGDEIPSTEFSPGEALNERDELGLIEQIDEVDGWSVRRNSPLIHEGFDESACAWSPVGNDRVQCVPEPRGRNFFADEQCTRPVEYKGERYIAAPDATSCSAQANVYVRDEAPYAGLVYTRSLDNVCTLQEGEQPLSADRADLFSYQPLPAEQLIEFAIVER